ncbi:MAG: hypothetical protein IPM91_09340 [Bacteroidetes bacterium]|nr:hypothetical protein [Bacteroidota bacterium]
MNKGIVGLRTLMKIHNRKFNGITFDKFYHTDSDGSAIVIEGDINLTPAYLHLYLPIILTQLF